MKIKILKRTAVVIDGKGRLLWPDEEVNLDQATANRVIDLGNAYLVADVAEVVQTQKVEIQAKEEEMLETTKKVIKEKAPRIKRKSKTESV
jgi:hypothetical protein